MVRGVIGWVRSLVLCAVWGCMAALVAHAQNEPPEDQRGREAGIAPDRPAEANVVAEPAAAPAQTGAAGASAQPVTPSPSSPKSEELEAHAPAPWLPPFSIRIDPFNWLIAGRFNLELEMAVWRFISVELVPVIIANTTPPSFNFAGRADAVSQHSRGVGPISGFSIGAGFWLFGTPFQGYVARVSLTDIGVKYRASDPSGEFDHVATAERHLQLYLGSHSRFGFFAVSGGLGLGYELHRDERCFVNEHTALMQSVRSGCHDDELQIMTDRAGTAFVDLHGPFYPFYILARFSIGVVFE